MRLKRIKLAGFKSFVEPTSIPFPGSMTAVVGPNGCGKSNVIDAVRWVLGESSAKNLRGDAMTDVIFNGSSSRKPLGQCSVELIFENASDRLSDEYAKYAELSVKRLVTRDGQSNYYLNSAKCRRRDITDLFLGTGLGPRSYAIIEQGMISRLIESKPQELRVFIEEAAGISKYKERRRETETRIRHTTENLERLADVRGELGQQIEKLERQAAAAERYTNLKAKERSLKSELAMLRYLAMQQKVDELQASLEQADVEYEALKAQLQGDEAGIEAYRTEQLEKKMELDALQQSIFTLATNITRVEQAKQFKHKRQQQINTDIQHLTVKFGQTNSELDSRQQELIRVEQALDEIRPEVEIIEEQYQVVIEQRDTAEETLQGFMHQRRISDESYHSKKRQAQTNHSQIQSTMSMQMRTQQRIKELNEERVSLDDPILLEQGESLEQELAQSEAQKTEIKHQLDNAKQALAEVEQQFKLAQSECNQVIDDVRQQSAKLNALEALQRDSTVDLDLPPVWQSLKVEAGYEHLVELVLSHYGEPLLLSSAEELNSAEDSPLPFGHRLLFEQGWSSDKPKGSLAEKITSARVPVIFQTIQLVADRQVAASTLQGLAPECSVLTEQGQWLSEHWYIDGPSDSSNGGIKRQSQIDEINQILTELSQQQAEQQEHVESLQQQLERASNEVKSLEQQFSHAHTYANEVAQKRGLIAMQIEQNSNRKDKVQSDIEQQQALLEQEQEQLERLSEQVEVLEAELFELETLQQQAEDKAQSLQQNVDHCRHQYELLTQKKHQLSLAMQQKVAEQNEYVREVKRLSEQASEYTEQIEQLKQELLLLDDSEHDNGEQLQTWLQQKNTMEEQKTQLQQALSDIEHLLMKTQQGQQGIRDAIEQKQKVRESVLLESEGMKARAATILEQLQETGQSIKQTMATMPEEADEDTWASNLERTTNAIKRLGAVNLAAVDEYKVQAERKAHLDAQDADLSEALETLQSAIRKIDKETRTRFSQTFEQVNADLKALFPKVFGGGSAYLALTDDDLLETGVTIMARPPGKKNSTIHLLSGGEKALTALSLVFAIFRLNPAPFCLLDEVDAPLDDANVGRFCNLVSEMSQSVQFIYITHNKIAMEMASHLTGVTMAEPGVSRMVAVDVDEAVNLALA